MHDWFFDIAFTLSRWLHIVCTTLLVGGVLFYEFVVPAAISELPEPQQFGVLGNIRWVYRRIVVLCVVLLILSGLMSIWQLWEPWYKAELLHQGRPLVQGVPWVVAHIVLGVIAMLICWSLTTRRRIPNQPLFWLRISLMILLVTIFLADVARHIRLNVRMHMDTTALFQPAAKPAIWPSSTAPTTAPSP